MSCSKPIQINYENQTPCDPTDMVCMLTQTFQTADSDTCPLSTNENNICFYNKIQHVDKPFVPGADPSLYVGVDQRTFFRTSTKYQNYITPPLDTPYHFSNIEFLVAPPDKNGNANCSYFDTYSPLNCTEEKMPDGTTRCKNDAGLPCIAGTTPQKIGCCMTSKQWGNYAIQGYQCVPNKKFYQCNPLLGKCELAEKGYESAQECTKACLTCPKGFVYTNDSACYRSTAPTNSSNGWSVDQELDKFTFKDKYKTPYKAYQCTKDGFIQCIQPKGCDGVKIVHRGNSAYLTQRCPLPLSESLKWIE